jgi:hypothetical protein
MRINEILTESEIQQLEEGPIGQAVAKGIGGVAKGVGAVGGAAVGAWDAVKQGFKAGRAAVSGQIPAADQAASAGSAPAEPAAGAPGAPGAAGAPSSAAGAPGAAGAPSSAAAPAATAPGGGAGEQPAAKDVNAAGPSGTAPAVNLTGAAKIAADKTAAVTQDQNAKQAGQTVYAQVKANIDKLDKPSKQRILQLVQKSIQAAPPPAAEPAADPAADPAAADPKVAAADPGAADPKVAAADPGAAAFGQMANTLTKEPAAGQATTTPAATTPPAGSNKMTPQQIAALKGKIKGGASATSAPSNFGKYVDKASGERIVGANKDGSVKTVNIKASKINTGNNLSEMLAANIEKHKKKLAEERAANYRNSSIFTK